jgi:hypothetical protein
MCGFPFVCVCVYVSDSAVGPLVGVVLLLAAAVSHFSRCGHVLIELLAVALALTRFLL